MDLSYREQLLTYLHDAADDSFDKSEKRARELGVGIIWPMESPRNTHRKHHKPSSAPRALRNALPTGMDAHTR
jgi:hypothetical protein